MSTAMISRSLATNRPPSPALFRLFRCGALVALFALSAPCGFGQRPPQGPMSQTRYHPADLGYELVWEDQFQAWH